ncbi:hypothetical protein [uncultured Gimesia sp.]|uniref:hypothetical protein n=1 Tax=uncultured Gimesia sp. TaxID=1678688 RepID=UPI0030DBCAED|tara:strand:+ start:9534 stop:10250 length:717 start_codon:yes stop_codon:yes gene_type:complete
MNDTHDSDELAPSDSSALDSSNENGTLVAWTANTGDSVKSHVVHIDSTGISWSLNIKKPETFERLLTTLAEQPEEATAIIRAESKASCLSRERLVRVTYAKDLNQLSIFDEEGKKQKIPDGKEGEQGQIFEAVQQYLGGTHSQEDADAWSVMQGPLFALAVTAAIGGLFIFLAADADPNYEASGRRSGMKQLMNWLGYTIGPIWTSVFFGAIGLAIFSFMIFLLVKRPQRDVLSFKLI